MVSPFTGVDVGRVVDVAGSRQDPVMAIIESSATEILVERELDEAAHRGNRREPC